MSLGGFKTLTLEQQGKCLLLGIGVDRLPTEQAWWVYKEGPPLAVMCTQDENVVKFYSVDEAIEHVALHGHKYKWA